MDQDSAYLFVFVFYLDEIFVLMVEMNVNNSIRNTTSLNLLQYVPYLM